MKLKLKTQLLPLLCLLLIFSPVAQAHDPGAHGLGNETPKPILGSSIYNVNSKWTNQDGKSIALSELRGKITVLAMTYTGCQAACPIITANMKSIESQLPQDAKDKVRFAIFSLDHERDTPAVLKSYAQKRKLDPQSWSLYQGSGKGVRDLAMILGIKFKKDEKGDFDHSNVITVLDQEGQISHQQVGLNTDPAETLAKIKKLAASSAAN